MDTNPSGEDDDHSGAPRVTASNLAIVPGQSGHGEFLGIAYRDHGPDWVELSLDWREDLVGDPETGVLASGPVISLLDTATSMAAWIVQERYNPQVTLDLRIDYVRASPPGKTIVARAECYKLSRSMAFVRGFAHDGDPADPVAHAAGIFMLLDSSGGGA